MAGAGIIFLITILLMILSILFFPKLKLGKISLSTYWIVTLLGAALMLLCGFGDLPKIGRELLSNSAVNPIKILVLFLSMSLLSVFLDELGFFRYLANASLRFARGGQKRLFFVLYFTVSLLTVFTSNDVVILSFTPFILYFSRRAEIDPMPYLAAEFVAANTWSLCLVIGNPTNIYLSAACGLDFLSYLKLSLIPTLFAGLTALLLLFLIFRKKLSAPMHPLEGNVSIEDKFLLILGVFHLAICTIFLACGSYLGIEMWLVALCSLLSLYFFTLLYSLIRRKKPKALLKSLRRAPYELIPFVLSMFVMIVVLSDLGLSEKIASLLDGKYEILTYGAASFLCANLLNNIPMSVLFSSVLSTTHSASAVFATIIGSNLGAFFTPIGALAGIMFSSILSDGGIKFGYLDFLKLGVKVAIPTLFAALLGLAIVV